MNLRDEAIQCVEMEFCLDCDGYCVGDPECEAFQHEVDVVMKEWQEEGVRHDQEEN